jgi:hypothetical protein
MNAEIDVRGVLASIRAPTLLIHRRNDARVDPEASRYLAQKISGARLAEIPGRDHPIWTGDVNRVADLIEEFLTGTHAPPETDRVLAALLVTRISDTARLGDRMWSERSQRFQEALRLLVVRHGGRIADQYGDVDDFAFRRAGARHPLRGSAARRSPGNRHCQRQGRACRRDRVREARPLGMTVRVDVKMAEHAGRGGILASRLVADRHWFGPAFHRRRSLGARRAGRPAGAGRGDVGTASRTGMPAQSRVLPSLQP